MFIEHNKKTKMIAIFAHNESQKILACLASVKRAISDDDRCIVLNNGSSDNTGDLVRAFMLDNPFCSLQEIHVGDKSNTWNVFIHELDAQATHYYFLDGDCELLPDSLSMLEQALTDHPEAHVAAALPAEGIGVADKELLLRDGGLCGNLYALSGTFVTQLRAGNVRLPIGLIGDDSLIGALAYWDLNPTQSWDMRRIYICEPARFYYEALSLLSWHDLRLYYRRKIRYSLRHFQNKLIKYPLKSKGVQGLPQHIDQLYAEYPAELRLRFRGIDTWFDWLALRQIKMSISRR